MTIMLLLVMREPVENGALRKASNFSWLMLGWMQSVGLEYTLGWMHFRGIAQEQLPKIHCIIA
jgi:hypothetical protein